jgi:glyceraldehyde 3-phosphate dehydrogenase
MTKIKVAINGFGRIGRLTTRNLLKKFNDQVEIVALNDLTSSKNLAYLFKYDSTYGKYEGEVNYEENAIIIDNNLIKVYAEKDPSMLPWGELGVDVVLECTGRFLSQETASLHLNAGAKKVILSAPAKDSTILTVVQGVNVPSLFSQTGEYIHQNEFQSAKIISNASCTTNCVAPILKVIEKEFGIVNANALTVHAYTATQMLQDAPSPKDFRDGRAAAQNMIPSKTGAAKAAALVVPSIAGKVNLSALRVPIITGSNVFISFNLEKATSVEELNSIVKKYANSELKGILEYSEDDLVSTDIIQNSHSTIFDSKMTEMISDKSVKLVVWYDNEWGYSSRLAELLINSK